jgi:exosortase/archaeosortase family protein
MLVRGVLHALGFGDVERYGHELLAVSRTGQRFSAAVSPWCSTLALVLVFGAGVVLAHPLPIRRRLRGFGCASAIVIVCNLARIVATIVVGVRRGPGAIESFHDGPATWFAVAYVLAAVAVFAAVLTRGVARGGTVQPPKSPQMEATTPGRL